MEFFKVENEPTVPFSFIKVDEKTGNELAGAEFTFIRVMRTMPTNGAL